MGAAALVRDPEVTARLRAYINLDAVGADGPVPLFQTGPGNGWLVGAWARAARAPRGGSYQAEVYRRLPSDTDFSVLMRAGIPGLNFAAVGDGYAYHTARDTPERLTARAIREMGATTLSTAEALDRTNLAQRSSHQAVYFDLAGTRALALRPEFSRALSVLAIVLATVALVRTTRVTVSAGGAAGVARTFAWALVGTAARGRRARRGDRPAARLARGPPSVVCPPGALLGAADAHARRRDRDPAACGRPAAPLAARRAAPGGGLDGDAGLLARVDDRRRRARSVRRVPVVGAPARACRRGGARAGCRSGPRHGSAPCS